MRVALITGITGQDGSYLAELLLEKGYEVHGIIRRSSTLNGMSRIQNLWPEGSKYKYLHYGDVTDQASLIKLVTEIQPDEIYNLAAMSHVRNSFDMPAYTLQASGAGCTNVLEAVRQADLEHKMRVYQASTSELFYTTETQSEDTPKDPRSPYGCAKQYAFQMCKIYREAYKMYICNGILFNHESPRRGETFVTRKITRHVAAVKHGRIGTLYLGNIDAQRDWGHARDYVRAMWMIMQLEQPKDYVIATGETHSVREFCELAFAHIGIHISWRGEGLSTEGYGTDGYVYIRIDQRFYRPTEIDYLKGDATRARKEVGWTPTVSFTSLIAEMVESDIKLYSTSAVHGDI